MDKIYEPQKTEQKIYRLWEKSGYFNPDKLPGKKGRPARLASQREAGRPFCIIMPPPNANAPLHIGHGVGVALQDIMIRYQRMKGRKALWLPGTDHAGFETQVVFEKELEKQGRSGLDMSSNAFYKAIWKYTQKNKKIVSQQLKQLGASCDWSRERFTLDKDIQKIVYQTLERLWKDGLLYRGKRIVNYCPKHKTAFSDLEVKYKEDKGKLYFVKYSCRNKNKWIAVATTRPETIPGDTAIAVNPKDKRYQALVGEMVIEPITQREIPVITDKEVDIDFGTGALKITPAHDSLDFEIGQRHNLETRETLSFDGHFNELAGPLTGLNIARAREKSIQILKENGSLLKEVDYKHEIGHCYKCGTIIEPMLMDQWFIAMTKSIPKKNRSLRDLAVEAVKNKKIKIIPNHFEKVFFHWMKNIRDWNISRQIRWGIPIPAYHCQNCGQSFIQINRKPIKCIYCQSRDIKKDADVLDTWFSSGQWPFATLMSPLGSKSKKDFRTFYPTEVMETGWDILFFWVARMIMLGLYGTGKIPFKIVYLHGLVRDKDRQKMSKSKGNVIDPLAILKIYGTDALRMALIIGNTAGNDIIISEEKIRGYRNFANKIWNAARFILNNLKDFDGSKPILRAPDKKILEDLKKIKRKVSFNLDNFRFSLAGELLYHYFWHTFADKIIEKMKNRIRDNKDKKQAQYILYKILGDCLKMLHPFMPFVTEALWQKMPCYNGKRAELLIIEKWA